MSVRVRTDITYQFQLWQLKFELQTLQSRLDALLSGEDLKRSVIWPEWKAYDFSMAWRAI